MRWTSLCLSQASETGSSSEQRSRTARSQPRSDDPCPQRQDRRRECAEKSHCETSEGTAAEKVPKAFVAAPAHGTARSRIVPSATCFPALESFDTTQTH